MTETGAGAVCIANREPREVGTACFGRPEPLVDMRIGEETADTPLVDVPGELLVRASGPDPRFGFFERYLKDEAATAAAWEGGWFHTGDIVRRDAGGQLHFVDRKKNVIRRSGENISAVEVEGALAQHPLVKAIGVVGMVDEVRGEEVLACIVPKRSVDPAEREAAARDILQFGLKRLAYFKLPGYVHFCEALPLTATAKIQRAELKRVATDAFNAGRICDTRSMKKRTAAGDRSASTVSETVNARPAPARSGVNGTRQGYQGVVLAVPVTVRYERYSIRSAQWWAARALEQLLIASGLSKTQIDGYCISSFSLAPDTAVGLTQHLGVSPRWLDHIPMGGAAGVVALRRAARAVQTGDAEVVACIAADTNHVGLIPPYPVALQSGVTGCGVSVWSRRTERQFRFSHGSLHAAERRNARGFRQTVRCAADQRHEESGRVVSQAAYLAGIPGRPPHRGTHSPFRLRHALRGSRGVSRDERGAGAVPQAPIRPFARDDRTA